MIWLRGLCRGDMIERFMQKWYDWQVYAEVIWLTGLYRNDMIKRFMQKWYDWDVYAEVIWLRGLYRSDMIERFMQFQEWIAPRLIKINELGFLLFDVRERNLCAGLVSKYLDAKNC